MQAPSPVAPGPGPRWTQRPPGSNWGDFGPDDQLGRLNLITADKVRQGAAEVREGLRFCLSLPLDYPGGNVLNPRRHPPVLRPTIRNPATASLQRVTFQAAIDLLPPWARRMHGLRSSGMSRRLLPEKVV